MRIFILGAGGMLGHKIYLRLKNQWDAWAVVRGNFERYKEFGFFDPGKFIGGVDLQMDGPLLALLDRHQPDVLINCAGLTLRKIAPGRNSEVIRLNAVLPHLLCEWAERNQRRLIHFSTDCVFSGEAGQYSESSPPDARDLYGLTKLLGELDRFPAVTVRSSIIGRELFHKTELLEWLISQRGKTIKGYSHVFYSGVTTNYMAYLVERILRSNKAISGLYHVSSPRLSKFEILNLINRALDLGIRIEPDPGKVSDKSLVGNRLVDSLENVEKPEWSEMIAELKNERELYEK